MNEAEATVFVVDDDDAIRDSLGMFLAAVGFAVETFESAEAFLRRLNGMGQSVLVLDQRLGGMSGLELQAELIRRGIGLPTVFITGHGDAQMSATAMRQGAIEVLSKPFHNDMLLASIQKGLAHAHP
jgi:FixJ family two-component response regulator